MLDKSHIGRTWPSHSVLVEAGRLRFFAKAIGETSPVYVDEAAAKRAGYRSLPVPPTFLFSLELERPAPFEWLAFLGVDLARILHGEQRFVYHRPACAGDLLTFESRITDISDKKQGALEFITRETRVRNQAGEHVADLTSVIIQRNA
ncbi:acyl dehydratase [Fluviicoccus keumensis]|uniref:Acyl dehydratase n=1 Tax=Fluviicoccus keumensis TaxID=1435465 RepID=A0A4Q7YI52_9GAMM|nr:MaoC family dehydratase N-terminal domain-containing protein [Fluviicoccus keumensis]RZU36798.1 acyl dehydratase [Fluviicoccus keumensis]